MLALEDRLDRLDQSLPEHQLDLEALLDQREQHLVQLIAMKLLMLRQKEPYLYYY